MREILCGRCGFKVSPTQRIKSRHTGVSYCSNFEDCDRRTKGEDLTYAEIVEVANRVVEQLK